MLRFPKRHDSLWGRSGRLVASIRLNAALIFVENGGTPVVDGHIPEEDGRQTACSLAWPFRNFPFFGRSPLVFSGCRKCLEF